MYHGKMFLFHTSGNCGMIPSMRTLLLLLATAALAPADVRIPPPLERTANMRIVHDAIGKNGPVLDVPVTLTDPITRAEDRADIRPPVGLPVGDGGWRDVISGFILSIGAFFAGRSFWRKKQGPAKALIPAVIVAGSLCLIQAQRAATIAQAAPAGDLAGPVKVRVLRTGNEVVLHLPPLQGK
jgi:hypothetical protein